MKFRSQRERLASPRCASTSSPATRARTSATCGRATGQKLAEVTFTNETASGWQDGRAPDAGPDHRGHDLHHVLLRDAAAASRSAPATSSPASTAPRCGAPSDRVAGGNGVYRYGAERASRTRPSARPTTGSTPSFERTQPPTRAPPGVASRTPRAERQARAPERQASRSPSTSRWTAPPVNTGSILLTDERRQPGHRPGHLRRGHPHRHADADRAADARQDLHGDGQERHRRRHRPRRQPPRRRRVVDLLDAAAVPVHDLRSDDATERRRRRTPSTTSRSSSACASAPPRTATSPALRFYKQANNTGTHVGHLWSADGQLLASIPFTNETASGWQSVELPNPVAITKDTVYVASYYSPGGYFPFDQSYFASAHDGGMLTAPGRELGRRQRRLPATAPARFPDRVLQRDELLGRRVASTARCRRTRAARGSWRPRRPSSASDVDRNAARDGDVRRAAHAGVAHRDDLHAARRRRRRWSPATVSYDAQTRTATLDPAGAARVPDASTPSRSRAARRRHRRRGQPAGGRQDLDLHGRRPVAGRGPGRPDAGADRPGRQVRHLLRRDPPQRGPERLRGSTAAPITAAEAHRQHDADAGRPRPSPPPRSRAHDLGPATAAT